MTESGGPSQHVEQPVPVNGPGPNAAQDPSQPVPSFVHVLPCTNPPVKYLDCLDGCATGMHVTLEDIQDLHVFYGRMTDAMVAKADHPLGQVSPDPCAICKATMVPSPTAPVLYMENCAHYFHYDCLVGWRRLAKSNIQVDCPRCGLLSSRAILWPQLFSTDAAKDEHFKLQKLSFGMDVSPQTIYEVQKCYVERKFPVFHLMLNGKYLTVRKINTRDDLDMNEPCCGPNGTPEFKANVTEIDVLREIQDLHLADQPRSFYLGDILPLEENAQFRAKYGLKPLNGWEKRVKLLLQFRCPSVRLDGPSGCSRRPICEFWHGWPKDTPKFIVERVKVRDFPRFFCLLSSSTTLLYEAPECLQRIRVHSQELIRCSAGFHPSTEDLQNIDGFAHKMAKQIMEPVVVPEQHLVCAFCHKSAESNTAWIHMQNCVHWLHVHCVPLVRQNNTNPDRTLDLHCPSCQVPSVRTIAWPGPFASDLAKQTIFGRQLAEFKLNLQADTQLAIVEVANKVNMFTLDYGVPNLVTIDVATAQQYGTIYYN